RIWLGKSPPSFITKTVLHQFATFAPRRSKNAQLETNRRPGLDCSKCRWIVSLEAFPLVAKQRDEKADYGPDGQIFFVCSSGQKPEFVRRRLDVERDWS